MGVGWGRCRVDVPVAVAEFLLLLGTRHKGCCPWRKSPRLTEALLVGAVPATGARRRADPSLVATIRPLLALLSPLGPCRDSQVVRWFWEVLQGLSLEQKRAFLQFTTGSDRWGSWRASPGQPSSQPGQPSAPTC